MTCGTCKFHYEMEKKSHWLLNFLFTFCSAEDAHLAAQNTCEELKQKLSTTEADKENQFLKLTAEIDDLNRTKTNLEERLIELIRYDLSLLQLY